MQHRQIRPASSVAFFSISNEHCTGSRKGSYMAHKRFEHGRCEQVDTALDQALETANTPQADV